MNAAGIYYRFGCGRGFFEGILMELGEPYTSIPPSILKFGEGGVGGWGSHCGAFLGTSAMISLVTSGSKASGKMIKELTGWYNEFLGSGSPLCHVSVTEWSKQNGVTTESHSGMCFHNGKCREPERPNQLIESLQFTWR